MQFATALSFFSISNYANIFLQTAVVNFLRCVKLKMADRVNQNTAQQGHQSLHEEFEHFTLNISRPYTL